VELPLVVEKLEALPDHFRVLEGEDPECQAVIRDFLLGMERQERGPARSVSITCVHKITNDREREHVYEEKKVRRRGRKFGDGAIVREGVGRSGPRDLIRDGNAASWRSRPLETRTLNKRWRNVPAMLGDGVAPTPKMKHRACMGCLLAPSQWRLLWRCFSHPFCKSLAGEVAEKVRKVRAGCKGAPYASVLPMWTFSEECKGSVLGQSKHDE
jgi:hypothetical protein